jgi:uroporphyrinogen decarboxylase
MVRADGTRVPLVEYLVDDALKLPITTELLGREWVDLAEDRASQQAYLDNYIALWYRLGYDFVRIERSLGFVRRQLFTADTAAGCSGERAWADEHRGAINNWAEFESYPWPTVEGMDFFPFEYVNSHLPEGMGMIASHAGGPYEQLWGVMSYEGLCLALIDDPDLVKAVSDRLGELMTGFYEHLLDIDNLVVVFPGDDMGFRTSTLLPPDAFRQYCLPWHRRFAAMAHEKGLPYCLHSCGNVELIMEDLITDVKLDGKHSYEDAIEPIDAFQKRYGDRIAVLGGVDVDVLASGSPEQVRERTRYLMEVCGQRGRFAVGSGSSIARYIPVENYLAMVDEAVDFAFSFD